jgi:hypothetical protein
MTLSQRTIDAYLDRTGSRCDAKTPLFRTLGRSMRGLDDQGKSKGHKAITAEVIYRELKQYGKKPASIWRGSVRSR